MPEDKKLFNEAAAEKCERVQEDDWSDQCYFCGMQKLFETDGKAVTIEESNSETGPMPSDMTDVWVCGRCEGSKDL